MRCGRSWSREIDFSALTDPQEVVDAYNEMAIITEDIGLTEHRVVESFPTLEAGHAACFAVHDALVAARRAA